MNSLLFYRLAIAATVLGCPGTFLTAQSTGSPSATITSLTNLSRRQLDSANLGIVNDAVNLDVSGDPGLLNPESRSGRQAGSALRSHPNQRLLQVSGNSQSLNGSMASLRTFPSAVSNSSAASRSPLRVPEKQQIAEAALIRHLRNSQSSDPNGFFEQTEKTPVAESAFPTSTSRPGTIDVSPTAEFDSLEKFKDPFQELLSGSFEGFNKMGMERACGSGCRLRSTHLPAESSSSVRRAYSGKFSEKSATSYPAPYSALGKD